MTTQPLQEQPKPGEAPSCEQRKADIAARVIETLGRPPALLHVQVRDLWESYYRVNIVEGETISCARITHSYFLQTDNAGNILGTTPRLTKQYR